jgi:hypothetical protein
MSETPQESQIAGVMYALRRGPLGLGALTLLSGLLAGAPAAAADKPWSIQFNSSVEGTSNLQQQFGGTTDLALRNSLEFSYYPVSTGDNSALFRLQALNSRYLFNPDYDSTFLIATALASRRVFGSTYGYGGYQFLFKQSNTASNITRQDGDLFGGLVAYRALGPARLIFHGYQFDYLSAAVPETTYQGHSAYVTWREGTTDRWIQSASFRSQWRIFPVLGALEWRNLVIAESTYRFTDWFSLRGEAIYLFSTASRRELNYNGWNVGVFSQFTL